MRIRYFVRKEDNKITAAFENEVNNVEGVLAETVKRGREETAYIVSNLCTINPNIAYTGADFCGMRGIATCHEEDIFDGEFGKELASAKLMEKYHRRMAKSYELALRELDRIKKELEEFKGRHEKKKAYFGQKIEWMSKQGE